MPWDDLHSEVMALFIEAQTPLLERIDHELLRRRLDFRKRRAEVMRRYRAKVSKRKDRATCLQCGKPMPRRKSNRGITRKFCMKKCTWKYHNKRRKDQS